MFRKAILATGLIAACGMGSAASAKPADVTGSYGGVAALAGEFTTAILPYIEQENLYRLFGEMQFGRSPTLKIAGTLRNDGSCRIKGSAADTSVVFDADWVGFGGGAGALVGGASVTTGKETVHGSMAYLRPFSPTGKPKPDARGSYAGRFVDGGGIDGEAVAGISDGASNTLTMNLRLFDGKNAIDFVAAADVNSDGSFASAGLDADGNIITITGTRTEGAGGTQLRLNYEISTPDGFPINVGGIIAILIG